MSAIPHMTPVEGSSNVSHVGYDHGAGELHVRFHSGGHYAYANVPEHVHQEMLGATSKGNFLRAAIIGKFTHRKVNADAS